MKRLNKKGFTIAEMIVVVAVMAVLLAVIGVSFSVVFTNRTKSAAKNIYNMLGTANTVGMSKGNCYIGLSADANGTTTVSLVYGGKTGTDLKVVEEKELSSKVVVKVKLNDGSEVEITPADSIMIGIDRATGGYTNVYKYATGTGTTPVLAYAANTSITDIIIGTYDIGLVKLTGKYYYK